jgi:hypothetical protein
LAIADAGPYERHSTICSHGEEPMRFARLTNLLSVIHSGSAFSIHEGSC